jgi:hypothetical protein
LSVSVNVKSKTLIPRLALPSLTAVPPNLLFAAPSR